MCAGEAGRRDNCALYNCTFVAIDHPRALDEILYILTCGSGVGFSVESKYVDKLPTMAEEFHDTDSTIVVADSRIGWASSFRELISFLLAGKVPKFDVSKVRQKGERLVTFGGRASGPEPLVDLFNYCIRVFRAAAGRKLSDLEVHGIVCKIGEIVVVGGVRRSALISLSDLSSARMRDAKAGQWWTTNPEYALANNSAVYDIKPTTGQFLDEWNSLYKSKSGERGIFYRGGIKNKTASIGKRDESLLVGTNPCGEISLRSAGMCNLTELVVRKEDTLETLKQKARIASILGTIQSTYTNFRYLRPIWKKNAEEERLLGVSLTGIFDHAILSDPEKAPKWLSDIRDVVNATNAEWAEKLGINPSAATTCTKPSGTVSQLVSSCSGIHPWHSKYYVRTVRQDNKDPITQFMIDQGVPHEPDLTKPDSTTIFSFPVAAPEGSKVRADLNPIDHLKLWSVYNKYWAEHQVSITVSVDEDEWPEVGGWVYKHFEELSGVSFLPMDKGTYQQAPYQDCTKEEYEALVAKSPKELDWAQLSRYETDDQTKGSHELACSAAGGCEVI